MTPAPQARASELPPIELATPCPAARGGGPDPRLPNGLVDTFALAMRDAALIAVARVVSVGAPPGKYSGHALAIQTVTLELVDVLRGPGIKGTVLTADYAVVENSPTAARAEAELDPLLFAPGAERIAVLHCRDVSGTTLRPWTGFDEVHGVMRVDELARVRAAVMP